MSKGSSLPYKLRPNKAVDRELFLGMLARLAASLKLENYRYVGLGGPFLEDFRLIHARLAIKDMVCIEMEKEVHQRQKFNSPTNCINFVHSTLESYLDSTDFETPAIIWFDYTEPGTITDQIERFATTIGQIPIGSILRITLNANPTSLGTPKPEETGAMIGSLTDAALKPTVPQWRLERFRERLGALFPIDLTDAGLTFKTYGKTVLRVLYLAVQREILSLKDRKVVWCLATHYADGQPMVTATLLICSAEDTLTETLIKEWEYYSEPSSPLLLDMPALSTLERLSMESSEDPKVRLGFALPKTEMGEDPFLSFKKFYRVFPHFSRVEL
ncbi:MAG: O-methyltransferase [Nitrosomonadales bacterium]